MEQKITAVSNYPNWLDRNEYPFSTYYFRLPAGKMHYVDVGKGDPIVMVHGNPGWSFEFRKIISELSDTNRCISVDHIGFGLSDKPVDFDYLPSSHAVNFEIFMDGLNLNNITLLFNDWGGPIALAYAIKHPAKIKKLIIMNTYLWSVENDRYYINFSKMMGAGIGKFLIKHFNMFAKFFLPKVMGENYKLPKNIHKHYYKHLATKNDRKGCYTFPREVAASGQWLDGLWKQHERINSIPTTFVWGMSDIAFREKELNYWIKHWNNPKVIKLDKVGHYPHEEFPKQVIIALKE